MPWLSPSLLLVPSSSLPLAPRGRGEERGREERGGEERREKKEKQELRS